MFIALKFSSIVRQPAVQSPKVNHGVQCVPNTWYGVLFKYNITCCIRQHGSHTFLVVHIVHDYYSTAFVGGFDNNTFILLKAVVHPNKTFFFLSLN